MKLICPDQNSNTPTVIVRTQSEGGSKTKNSPQNQKYYEATGAALYNSVLRCQWIAETYHLLPAAQ
ncbi:hypothetical protein T01_7659 [Trichinella spiralis]|uniref:Uncharacterized protein n=1 Tax=Trichinella spiralis TaxID=6334 RepID=A0A0V1BI99_TRISP|nr:hypothetical protein T01_7659 [Trichinella spiralis]